MVPCPPILIPLSNLSCDWFWWISMTPGGWWVGFPHSQLRLFHYVRLLKVVLDGIRLSFNQFQYLYASKKCLYLMKSKFLCCFFFFEVTSEMLVNIYEAQNISWKSYREWWIMYFISNTLFLKYGFQGHYTKVEWNPQIHYTVHIFQDLICLSCT